MRYGNLILVGLAVPFLAGAASAAPSDLDLALRSGGLSHVVVRPGDTVHYSLVGELSDNANEGLALFLVDLDYDGGALAQANDPVDGSTMDAFSNPEGLNNPQGFGGTLQRGRLVQVGGAQNTILNTFAAAPSGTVTTGVAALGSPAVLATGSVVAPTQHGTYTLAIENPIANVVRAGETGVPFWAVDAVPTFTVTNLTVEVISLRGDVSRLGLASGGSQALHLDGGPSNAGRFYWLLTSTTGASPGIVTGPNNLVLPLNAGPLFDFMTLVEPSPAQWQNNIGFLDGTGRATSLFAMPPGSDPGLAGTTLTHAWVIFVGQGITLTSNPVTLTLSP